MRGHGLDPVAKMCNLRQLLSLGIDAKDDGGGANRSHTERGSSTDLDQGYHK